MRRRRYRGGAGGYRGRRTLTDILKIIAVVLAVLVVLLTALLLAVQRFIVYTEDGIRVDLPFFQREETPPSAPNRENISVLEEPAGSGEPADPVPEEPADPAPEETGETMSALQLPLQAVLDGTAQQQLAQAGADALVLEMKNAQGALAWYSQQPLAQWDDVNGDQAVNEQLQQWNQGDVYTVARVCCFRDNAVPYHRNSVALRASYGNWRDELGLRWLDPSGDDAQAYVAGLCGELAQLGFDEIVLECCAFPTQGNLEALAWREGYDPSQAGEETAAFLEQVRAQTEPYDTRVSIRIQAGALSGEDGSGLSPQLLEQQADRIWMDGEPDPLPALTQAGITDPQDRLVEITASLEESSAQLRAVLEEGAA